MKTRDVFIKLMNYIGKYRFLLLVSILLAFATVALTLYVPILFGQAIDGIIAAGKVDFGLVSGVLTKILIIVLICSALTWIMNLINNRLTYRIGQDIRNKAIEHMQVLPLKYLDGHTIGDITDRIIADVDMICDGLLLGFTQLFSGVVTIVLTLVFMFSKSVHISLFVIALTPLSFFVAKFIAKHYLAFLAIFLVLLYPAIYGNNHTSVYYDLTQTLPDSLESVQGANEVDEKFEMNSAYMLLVDKNLDSASMNQMIKELKNTDGILSVLGTDSLIGPALPREFIPDDALDKLESDEWKMHPDVLRRVSPYEYRQKAAGFCDSGRRRTKILNGMRDRT